MQVIIYLQSNFEIAYAGDYLSPILLWDNLYKWLFISNLTMR